MRVWEPHVERRIREAVDCEEPLGAGGSLDPKTDAALAALILARQCVAR